MSNSSSTPNSVVIDTFQTDLAYNYCITAALAFVSYEYLITLRHEYEFLRMRKWTAATWLFLANRYLMLIVMIVQVLPTSAGTYVCRPSLLTFEGVLIDLPLAIPAVFSALRVFALLNRAYLTAGLVILLGLVPVGSNVYQDSQNTYQYVDNSVLGSSCYVLYNFSAICADGTCPRSLALASLLAPIAADIITIATTWIKTYRHVRQATSIGMSAGYSETLLEYGTLYFVIICVMNIAELLVYLVPAFQLANPLSIFSTTLPNVVISRFLINLRYANSSEHSDGAHFSQFSIPAFSVPSLPAIISVLGEPLTSGYDEELNEGEPNSAGFCEDCSEVPNHGDNEGASGALYASSPETRRYEDSLRGVSGHISARPAFRVSDEPGLTSRRVPVRSNSRPARNS
ncbi:hypothetical protein NM688_g4638 [Phlebia brevispora]|uniref:Uncharacterized protein n=1 Tax=Phlebia brevispora TaxID=194682 RepID=A0ACC1T2D8_9APHY|nr:hypothetical protein NM688_g4638 [Phlebia brevispora]